MANPIPRPAFDAMMKQAGLPLTEAEAQGIHAATVHVARFAAMVRTPRPIAAEPAIVFAPVPR